MINGLIVQSLGLYLFISTYFFNRNMIIIVTIFTRILNGIVNSSKIPAYLLSKGQYEIIH